MSRIKVYIDLVHQSNNNLNSNIARVANVRSQIPSVLSSLDPRITSRNGIHARLSNAVRSLQSVEEQMRALHIVIHQAMERYWNTEQSLNNHPFVANENNNKPSAGYLAMFLDKYVGNPGDFLANFRDSAILFGSNVLDSEKYLILSKELRFKLLNKDGKVFIQTILGDKAKLNVKEYQRLLKIHLGDKTSKWTGKFINGLANDGRQIYDRAKKSYNQRYHGIFGNTKFEELNRQINQLKMGRTAKAFDAFKNSFKDNVNIFNDFKGWKNSTWVTKAGKSLGLLGTGLMVYQNYEENEGFNKEFAVDSTVDIVSSAAAMATGAAIGSFFLPPAGTIVGAVAGATINFLINTKFGDPKASVVDRAKEGANKLVDATIDGIRNMGRNIGKSLATVFW